MLGVGQEQVALPPAAGGDQAVDDGVGHRGLRIAGDVRRPRVRQIEQRRAGGRAAGARRARRARAPPPAATAAAEPPRPAPPPPPPTARACRTAGAARTATAAAPPAPPRAAAACRAPAPPARRRPRRRRRRRDPPRARVAAAAPSGAVRVPRAAAGVAPAPAAPAAAAAAAAGDRPTCRRRRCRRPRCRPSGRRPPRPPARPSPPAPPRPPLRRRPAARVAGARNTQHEQRREQPAHAPIVAPISGDRKRFPAGDGAGPSHGQRVERYGRARKRARIVFTPTPGNRIVTFMSLPAPCQARTSPTPNDGCRSLAPTCRPPPRRRRRTRRESRRASALACARPARRAAVPPAAGAIAFARARRATSARPTARAPRCRRSAAVFGRPRHHDRLDAVRPADRAGSGSGRRAAPAPTAAGGARATGSSCVRARVTAT